MTAEWEEIHGFHSMAEYERFSKWLDAVIADGVAHQMPVGRPYSSPYFPERWVRHGETGRVWRLVGPEAPFRGVFLPVEDESEPGV